LRRLVLGLVLVGLPLAVGGLAWWRARSTAADPLAAVRTQIGTRAATTSLEELRREYPRNAEVFFLSARQARWEGKFDFAAAHLSQAEALGWDVSAIERERVLVGANTDFPRYRPALQGLLEHAPADVEVLLALGEGELRSGRHGRALEYADRVLELEKNNARPLALRGAARLEARRLDLARADLEAALAAEPESPTADAARLALARCLLDLGDFAKARELFRVAAVRDPGNPMAHFGAGRSASYLGSMPEAEESFLAVLKIMPGHVDTLLSLAQVVEQSGDLNRALGYLEAAEKGDPKRLETLSRMAKLLHALGQTERAAAFEERYRALDPTRTPLVPGKPMESP
jgi:tetratricopeptide (TPR) repeat protein